MANFCVLLPRSEASLPTDGATLADCVHIMSGGDRCRGEGEVTIGFGCGTGGFDDGVVCGLSAVEAIVCAGW